MFLRSPKNLLQSLHSFHEGWVQNPWYGIASAYLFVLIVVVLISLALRCVPAQAHDQHRPDLDNFYSNLKDPKGNSCCNLMDCHTTDAEIRPGKDGRPHWWARLAVPNGNGGWTERPEWMEIPDDKVLHQLNPTGEAVFCHTISWKLNNGTMLDPASITVRCFLPESQS